MHFVNFMFTAGKIPVWNIRENANVEQTTGWESYFFKKIQNSNFHHHIWIQHKTCIQMSTNKPSTLGERLKEHTANIANNLSAVAEHHQKTGHKPDLENTKILCREDKLIPRKVREAIFIRKETSPTLNRDGGRELSKIYDSLLETPRSRTPSTASSRSESVSQHSATIRWGRRRVSLKYSDQKRECCWTVLKFLWSLVLIQ